MMACMARLLFLNFAYQVTMAIFGPYVQIMLRNKGYSHAMVGVIIALGQVATMVVPLGVSALDDRTRRTRSIAVVMSLVGVGLFVPAALVGSMWVTVVCFFGAMGCYMALNPLFDGYQNRVLEGDARRYGMARAAGTLGYVIALSLSVVVGFPVETDNWSICQALLMGGVMLVVAILLSPRDVERGDVVESEAHGERGAVWGSEVCVERGVSVKTKARAKVRVGVFSERFYLLMAVAALTRVAQAIPDKLLSSYMTEVLNLGGNFAGMTALGAMSEFVMMILCGRLLQRGKTTPYVLVLGSAVALAVRLLIYYFFPNVPGLVAGQLLHSMTFGAFHIGVTQFVSREVSNEHYALAMSFYWAIATNLPQMIGSLLGGFVIDSLGYAKLFLYFTLFPVLAIVMALVWRRKLK